MKKKIAIVISHPIQHFCPQYASLATHPSLDIKVFFASSLGYKKYTDPNFKREISWNNLRLDEFNHEFLNGGAMLPADRNLDVPDMDDVLEAFHPDLIILHGYFQKFQRRAYKWGRKNKISLAYISDSELRHKLIRIKEWIKYPFVRNYFKNIDFFLSVGDANDEYYKYCKVPVQKLVRMRFPIDRVAYRHAYPERSELAARIRAQFGLSGSDLTLSVVGKLVSWKNQGDLIDAMERLESTGVIINLFVIGSGEQKELLEQKAAKLNRSRVHFAGFIQPEQLPAFYAASDIYIHPASLEPHSLAVSEAIYMGCPILISDRCGSYGESDDVQDGKNGYIFRCGDIGDISNKILLLSSDKDKRAQFSYYSHMLGEEFQERSHGGFVTELLAKMIG